MKKSAIAILGLFVAAGAMASELDAPAPADVPNALVVRVDASGKREVFKANLKAAVKSDEAAQEALAAVADANRITPKAGSELDKTSSQEAWCYYYNPYYYGSYSYGYSYAYYGYSYWYRPTYSYCGGAYSYYYYWY